MVGVPHHTTIVCCAVNAWPAYQNVTRGAEMESEDGWVWNAAGTAARPPCTKLIAGERTFLFGPWHHSEGCNNRLLLIRGLDNDGHG